MVDTHQPADIVTSSCAETSEEFDCRNKLRTIHLRIPQVAELDLIHALGCITEVNSGKSPASIASGLPVVVLLC